MFQYETLPSVCFSTVLLGLLWQELPLAWSSSRTLGRIPAQAPGAPPPLLLRLRCCLCCIPFFLFHLVLAFFGLCMHRGATSSAEGLSCTLHGFAGAGWKVLEPRQSLASHERGRPAACSTPTASSPPHTTYTQYRNRKQ